MRIFLAGAETAFSSYKAKPVNTADIFLTFQYDKASEKFLDMNAGWKGLVVVDSGAHSFFGHIGLSATPHIKKAKDKMPDPEEHFRRYMVWLARNINRIDYFVELDLQELVGYERLMQWRQEYKDAGFWKKCITVYHSPDGWEKFEALVEASGSRYIGVEGLRQGKPMLPYGKIIRYAYEKHCRVHGFAFTRPRLLHEYPFFSVDSSSWTLPVRYGKMPVFYDGGLVAVESTQENFFKYGVNPKYRSKFKKREASVMKLEMASVAYTDMAKYMTSLWEKRGVKWNMEESAWKS